MSVINKVRARFRRASQHFADKIYDGLDGSEWSALPEYACRRLLAQLGLCEASQGAIRDMPVVYLTAASGVKFVGPDVPEKWGCSIRRRALLRKIARSACESEDLHLTDGHYALIDNILTRYITEFSAYPFQPVRTQNILPGDVFVDIGAFRGYVTLKASRRVGTGGFVYSIEPIEENLAFIKAHCDINAISNVACLAGAVTDEIGTSVELYSTGNQANACVPDYLSGPHAKLSVKNISTAALADTIMTKSPRRIIFSITTNGTEMSVAASLVEELVHRDIDYLELTVPIVYTRGMVSSFLSSLEQKETAVELSYPWLKVVYRK